MSFLGIYSLGAGHSIIVWGRAAPSWGFKLAAVPDAKRTHDAKRVGRGGMVLAKAHFPGATQFHGLRIRLVWRHNDKHRCPKNDRVYNANSEESAATNVCAMEPCSYWVAHLHPTGT